MIENEIDSEILKCFGGVNKNSLLHKLHITDTTDDHISETSIDQLQIIKHSSYYDNETLVPLLTSKKDNFHILCSNIESINAKFDELNIFVQLLREKDFEFDAICLQETWLSEKADYSQLQLKLQGYKSIPQGKSCGSKGGLVIYLKESYNYDPELTFNKSKVWEGQFIKINGPSLSKSIILGNIYRPPRDDTNENCQIFIDEFSPIIANLSKKNTEVIIAGDTNVNLLKLNEKEVYSDFFDLLTHHSFYPKITLPTRFSNTRGTLIDNVFCKLTDTTINSSAGILAKKFSDHQPYFLCLDVKQVKRSPVKFIKIRQQKQKKH